MRYVTIPNSYEPTDPVEGTPVAAPPIPFARAVRICCVLVASSKTADAQTLRDVRHKFDRAQVGDTVDLTDEEWKLLEPEFKRPNVQAHGHPWSLLAEDHQRAWLDAPVKDPRGVAASNGAERQEYKS